MVIEAAGGERELDLTCFKMAAKGEKGCGLVQDEDLKHRLRQFWVELLVEQGIERDGLDWAAPGQPFFLRLMRGLLIMAEDPDRDFLLQGEKGFPVGVLKPLPRTEHMYEEQTSWRLEDDPWIREEVWRSNYSSVSEHEDFVRQHFESECEEGLMEKVELKEAVERYGSRLAISSLSVLVEEAHNGKKRVIHDASHGVKINHRIRCRDKLRSPGAGEKQYILAYYSERNLPLFSLVGDVSKAHRRFLHDPEERGLLACRVRDEDDHVYINKVGTFGVASASYWWSRISGAGLRLGHELLGPRLPVELLLFADDLESLGNGQGGRRGIVLVFLYLSVLGFPFKWSKQRGGLRVEWIGLCTDYVNMSLGLSVTRSAWVQKWTLKLALGGRITSKEMEQGLGRLGFTAGALIWERPFLGPLYAWCAAVRGKPGILRVPSMLRAILRFIGERMAEGGDFQKPRQRRREGEPALTFFTDAKATEESAWIGGYVLNGDGNPGEWFSEQVTEDWASWMFVKKDPKRVIAALELLATLVAVKLWVLNLELGESGRCMVHGGTDNLGNTYALSKSMSTKYPLTLLVMELSESLRQRRCELHLQWYRRDGNQWADDLTNGVFEKFDPKLRLRWDGGRCPWRVLTNFLGHAKQYHEELVSAKSSKVSRKEGTRRKKTKLPGW